MAEKMADDYIYSLLIDFGVWDVKDGGCFLNQVVDVGRGVCLGLEYLKLADVYVYSMVSDLGRGNLFRTLIGSVSLIISNNYIPN